MHGKKKVHVFYNDPENTPSNRVYADIFKRVGYDVEVLFVGRKGTLAALKALRRNECVLIMPDVVLDESATIVVPFMNRLLRVMPGCAFFALHSNAIIASVFCEPLNAFGVDMSFADTIDSDEFVLEDKDQNIFLMTKALFAQFEDKFLSRPYHWNYWDRLAYYSSGLDNFDLNSIVGYDDVIEKRARLIHSFDAAQTV